MTYTTSKQVIRHRIMPAPWQCAKHWAQRIQSVAAAMGSCVAGDSGPPVLFIHGFGASAYHWRYQVPSLARNHRVYAIDLLGVRHWQRLTTLNPLVLFTVDPVSWPRGASICISYAGFGWSPKALVEYDGYKVWARQLGSFIKEVILPDCGCESRNAIGMRTDPHGTVRACRAVWYAHLLCDGRGSHRCAERRQNPVLVGNSLGGYNALSTAAAYPELVCALTRSPHK